MKERRKKRTRYLKNKQSAQNFDIKITNSFLLLYANLLSECSHVLKMEFANITNEQNCRPLNLMSNKTFNNSLRDAQLAR